MYTCCTCLKLSNVNKNNLNAKAKYFDLKHKTSSTNLVNLSKERIVPERHVTHFTGVAAKVNISIQ